MNTIRWLTGILAVFFILGMAANLVAQEPPPPTGVPVQQWFGYTSQGLPLNFSLAYTESGPMVQDWSFSLYNWCQKTKNYVSMGFGFFGYALPASQFDFNQTSLQWSFAFSGSVYGESAAGKVENNIAALVSVDLNVDPGTAYDTSLFRSEKCESGVLYWNAWPVSTPPKGTSQQSSSTVQMDSQVTVYKDGPVIMEE